MPSNSPYAEAVPGSLPRQVLIDLMLMREFLNARDVALHDLLGVPLRRSALRDELLRACVIEFGFGRLQRVSYYQERCSAFGSGSTVKHEIRMLAEIRILVTKQDPDNLRALLVVPTNRLVRFYSKAMQSLAQEVQTLFIRRAEMSR